MKYLILFFIYTLAINAQFKLGYFFSVDGITPQQVLTNDYTARVEADGGEIINSAAILSAYTDALANGYLDNVKLWVSPSYGVKQDANGKIITFYDLSSNSNDLIQADTSKAATYQVNQINSYPDANFDGTSDVYNVAFTLEQPETIYLVVNQVSYTLYDVLVDGSTLNTGYIKQYPSTSNFRAYAGAISNFGTLAVGTYGLITVMFNGASSTTTINGGSDSDVNLGTNDMGGVTLGAQGNLIGWSNIDFVELIVTNVAGTHKSAIKSFSNTKYSLY